MGHYIGYWTCDDTKTARKLVAEDIAEYEIHNSDSHHYDNRIVWKESMRPFGSYDEAYDYLESSCRSYEEIAVRFRDTSEAIDSGNAKTRNLVKRIEDLKKQREDYVRKHSVFERSAKFIGCPECGSKLNRESLAKNIPNGCNIAILERRQTCPVCGTDLRPRSTRDDIERYDERIQQTQLTLDKEKKALSEKAQAKAPIRWLIRMEFHC